MRVVGVDGCSGGWVAVTWDTDAWLPEDTLSARFHPSFVALLDACRDAVAIGVDIPIGLSDQGLRDCDIEARKVLRWKWPAVFHAPHPRVLFEPKFEHANERLRAFTGKGISQQAFNICRKIAEVNWAMEWETQDRVFEVHPEVGFWELNGEPMRQKKDKPDGYNERCGLLEKALGIPIWPRTEAFKVARPASPDDLLDATVAAWTARRVAEGTAERLPANPPVDRRGLRMEIVF